jgi:nicotinate-nucleotide adenylyltransferase
VGILGGTFNPPHLGHLLCAQASYEQLGLDTVVLMVAASPPHKEIAGDPGARVRAELCRQAIAGDDRFEVSTLELDREGPSFTVDTLRAMASSAPGDELIFIAGGDIAAGLPGWREPGEVLRLARFAVAERAGAGREQILDSLAVLEGASERVEFFDLPRVDISSSEVRSRAAAGLTLRYMVPAGVSAMIKNQALYGSQALS